MKTFKRRDKYLLLLKKELDQIRYCSTQLNVRGRIRKATKYLGEAIDLIERNDSVILAVKSVKVKNIYLARALQNERERSGRLLQEKIEIQSAYHDVLREKAELKKTNWNLEQHLMSDLEDYKSSILPSIVDLSDHVTKKIMKYESLRSISSKRNTDSLPPRNLPNISFGRGGNNSNQPVSAVNPMVKGCVIQKPTINLRRVPFPNETRSSMFEYVNVNSPILEESEENISPANLSRRSENSLRNTLNVSSNRRQVQRPEASANVMNYCDPSPAEDNQVNVRLEPVVRLEDVTRLLQHSTIRLSETPNETPVRQSAQIRESVNQHWSPEVLVPKISTPIRPSVVTSEDPLEGSSWMYQGPSVNIQEDRSQPTSSQNNSSYYQSRVQFTPDYIRNTPKNNRTNANQPVESMLTADEMHLLSTRRKKKFFHSCESPSLSSGQLNISIDATRPIELDPHLRDEEENEVVSSSNDGENALPLTLITQRKRREVLKSSFSRLSGEIDEDNSRNSSAELDGCRRSIRCRKPVTRSTDYDYSATNPPKSNSVSKRDAKTRNQKNSLEVEDSTLDDSEIAERRGTKKMRKTSKKILSNSNISSSDLDESSHGTRSTRNRSNVSYKEPSLHVKMRRD